MTDHKDLIKRIIALGHEAQTHLGEQAQAICDAAADALEAAQADRDAIWAEATAAAYGVAELWMHDWHNSPEFPCYVKGAILNLTPQSSRDYQAKRDDDVREECARIAYRICAETRHVTLGDKIESAIRASKDGGHDDD